MLLDRQRTLIGWSINFMTSIQLVLVSNTRVSSFDTIWWFHRVTKCSLNLIGAGGSDMAGSTGFFCIFRVPVALIEVFYRLSFDLEVIGWVVVDRIGGECWTLDFGADGFVGGFGRAGDCFATTFPIFNALVLPNVFAASESGFLPADTFFKGGCGGWVAGLRFSDTHNGVDNSASNNSPRR
jgi:hypothetical protein